MSSRIVSMSSEFEYKFPQLPEVYLTEEKVLTDSEGNEITYDVGDVDPESDQSIPELIITVNKRSYWSVPDRYTLSDLITAAGDTPENYDIREDTQEDLQSISEYILEYRGVRLAKYKENNNYLTELGLPSAPEFLVETEPVGVAST